MERAMSFGSVAEDYDRLRPSPPPEAVDWVVPAGLGVAVDVGAGTGAMTRVLLGRAGRVVAVEPDARMRAVLARRSPEVEVVEGRGEAIPLPDASADLVVVASAWHWMDTGDTVAEVARVLRDGGRFAVLWNGRNTRVAWMYDVFSRLIPEDAERDERERRIRALSVPAGQPFAPVEAAEFDFTRRMTVTELAASVGTYSRIILLGPDGVAAAVEQARQWLSEHFGGPDAEVDVPYRARAFRTRRLPR